ncbi:hypothetical protein SAMN05216559_0008 [Halomicrobium zhouii]|uniref:DUF7968 domain-containing protein n=1 Tax=Halomicrobium zhouii TaxID=767519 RepID=A0A1I6K186_9EURY|nr:hypothetical protein [Halomicrobium zhouii]SFR84961.1 hypothetical protein SAMN05216559_0008 [Halomicrobium zhouii]
MSTGQEETTAGTPATTVVVSYPPDMGEDGQAFLERASFRNYLARAWDEIAPGETVEEMVNLGCCTDAQNVPLTVESVDGGTRMGPDTAVEFVEGDEPAGLGCDW